MKGASILRAVAAAGPSSASASKAKQIDWTKARAIFAPEDVQAASALRNRHAELSAILATPLPKIDFAQYKAVLANKSIAEQAEKALASFKAATVDPSAVIATLEKQRAVAVQQAKETAANVEKAVAQYKEDLAAIQNLQAFDELKIDDVYAANPGLEQAFLRRLKEGKPILDDEPEKAHH